MSLGLCTYFPFLIKPNDPYHTEPIVNDSKKYKKSMGCSSDTKPIIYDSKKIICDEYTKKNTKSQWVIPAITHLFYYRYVLFK